MSRARGPLRAKQFHVKIDVDEHKRIRVVAAEEGLEIAGLFRALFMEEVNARYTAIVGRRREKARPRP